MSEPRYVIRTPRIDMAQLGRGMAALPTVLRQLGYSSLRPGQDEVVKCIMSGRDVLGILPTSLGKTACFIVPTLALKMRTLVFSPLISLMRDQEQSALRKGVRAGSITSHNPAMAAEYLKQWLRGDLELLFIAPERLRRDDFLEVMRKMPPDMVVLDEAHCLIGDHMVATEFGPRRMEDFYLSDQAGHPLPRVWSRSKSGSLELQRVVRTWQHSAKAKKMLRIQVRNIGTIECTDDHVWFCGTREVAAKNLKIGDTVSCKTFGGQDLRGLNADQLQLVIGSYFGDGGLGCTGGSSLSYRVQWTHGVVQKEYCEWKAALLGGTCNPVERNGYSGKAAVRGRSAVFQLPGPIGRGKGGKHCKKASVPSWMLKQAGAKALAIWLMDDGSCAKDRITLHTEGFTEAGVKLLQSMLKRRFKVGSKKEFAKGWRIVLNTADTEKFANIVKEHIRPEFMYKLGKHAKLKPWETKSAWDDKFSTALYPVKAIFTPKQQPEWVYDIEVEKNHNFFVFAKVGSRCAARSNLMSDTKQAVLVHNCLSSWSVTFRAAYRVIGDFVTEFQPKLVVALTATCPPRVEADIRHVMCIEEAIKVLHYPRRTNLDLKSQLWNGPASLLNLMERANGPAVIYCATQKRTEELALELQALSGQEVGFYHGGLTKTQRSHTQDRFMQGDIQWMCATNAFGMGVDKSDIRLVVHRDHAGSMEAQAQECVHPESWISTSSGIVLANEVELGENMPMFVDFNQKPTEAKVVKCLRNKTVKLVELRTKLGSTVLVTPNHPLLEYRSGFIHEIAAKDIGIGACLLAATNLRFRRGSDIDILSILRSCPEPVYAGVSSDLVNLLRTKLSVTAISSCFKLNRLYDYNMYKAGNKAGLLSGWTSACQLAGISDSEFFEHVLYFKTKASKRIKLPRCVTADIAWLAGIVATDGYMFKAQPAANVGYGAWCLKLGNTNPRIADKFQRVVEGMGLHVNRSVRRPSGEKLSVKDLTVVETSSPILLHMMTCLGIPTGKKSYTVRVSPLLFQAHEEIRCAYLAGLFDGDGCVGTKVIKPTARLHSASWYFISDVAMLVRTLALAGSVSAEDYTCKRDVMRAHSDHGYTLTIYSASDVSKLGRYLSPYAVKNWEHLTAVSPDRSVACRRPKVYAGEGHWLLDSVEEIHTRDYAGDVLNWRVEPGNHLLVNGILTHNCGRGGRDGKYTLCMTYQSDDTIRTHHFLIGLSNPSFAEVQMIFKALQRTANQEGIVTLSKADLAQKAGLKAPRMDAILNILSGARVIDRAAAGEKVCSVRLKNRVDDYRLTQLMEALFICGNQAPDGFTETSMERLSTEMDLKEPTLKKRLKDLATAQFIDYVPPEAARPIRLQGGLELVDAVMVDELRQLAFDRLDQVVQYVETPDAEKHAFIERALGVVSP